MNFIHDMKEKYYSNTNIRLFIDPKDIENAFDYAT